MSVNKRLLKEVKSLILQQNSKPLLENDFLVHLDENNANKVKAIIKAPWDSVYRHKFIRLDFNIPDDYPHVPPEVFFVNFDGVRIHPNFYENGKCCATILNTWGDSPLEKWTSSMGIETILVMFHSFLDNNPYTYEPGGSDDPTYTTYVLHESWWACLIRYLQYEKIPVFIGFIHNYMLFNIETVFNDLETLKQRYPYGSYRTRCFEVEYYTIDYARIIYTLQDFYNFIDYTENVAEDNNENIDFNDFLNREYQCNICYDTTDFNQTISLNCKHTFHKECLQKFTLELCPMCRTPFNLTTSQSSLPEGWMINPLTKRRIKIGSKTYNSLVESGHLLQ